MPRLACFLFLFLFFVVVFLLLFLHVAANIVLSTHH